MKNKLLNNCQHYGGNYLNKPYKRFYRYQILLLCCLIIFAIEILLGDSFYKDEKTMLLLQQVFSVTIIVSDIMLIIIIVQRCESIHVAFKRILPKRFYLSQIRKVKISKYEVAALFKTEVVNVEKAYDKYLEPKNPFKKKFSKKRKFVIQLSVTILTSLVSTLLVLLTLFEMQADRNAAYRPCITFGKTELAFAWDNNFRFVDEPDEYLLGRFNRWKHPDTILNSAPKIKMYNIGAASAKNIDINWYVEKNINQYSKQIEELGYRIHTNDKKDAIWLDYDDDRYEFDIVNDNYYDFLLTSPENYVFFTFPEIYVYFFMIHLSLRDNFEITADWLILPNLYLNITYKDIQENNYSINMVMNIDIKDSWNLENGDGYALIEITTHQI